MGSFRLKIFNSRFLYPVALCYIALFFPLIASLNHYFELESNVISLTYRTSTFLIAIIIILREMTLKTKTPFARSMWFLLVFWAYYIVKLLIDLYVLDLILDPMQSAFYYFTQAVCIGFVNMLAIYYMGKKLNMVLLNKFLLILFASINIIFGLSFFLKYGFNIMEYASLRVSLLSENTGIEYLNPITIGMNGAYLFISLLYIKEIKLIHFLLFVFAIFNLVISASKGPILSLAIVLFVYFFLKLKFEPKTLLKIVCGVTLSVMLFNSSIFESFVIFQRFTGAEEESTAQRNVAIEYALEQISICPLFGTNYFVVKNHSSPHNIFIDIILSTGVLGLFLFLPVIVKFLMRVYNRIADVPIMAFGLLAFCLAQTSGYVFGASDFWAFLGLILAYNHQNKGNLKTEYLKYS